MPRKKRALNEKSQTPRVENIDKRKKSIRMKFNYKTEEDMMVITFDGDLIGEENGPEIIEAVNDQINNGLKLCVVNISKVRYINSSGIGVLITILTKFRNKDGEVVLINPSDHVKKLLVITKLNAIFTIADDLEQAKSKLNK